MAKDFNVSNDIKMDSSSFAKAVDIGTIPPDYTHMTNFSDYANYCDAPAHMNIDSNFENIDLNQYWDQPPMDDRNRMIEEGMGPGHENDVEQPPEAESAGHCDPPDNADFGYDLNVDV